MLQLSTALWFGDIVVKPPAVYADDRKEETLSATVQTWPRRNHRLTSEEMLGVNRMRAQVHLFGRH